MQKLSLQRQLMISMALLIVLPILFIVVLGNYFYSNAIDEQANEFTTEMLAQVSRNVDSSVTTVDRVIEYLASDADVLSFLRLNGFYDEGRIEYETEVRKHLRLYSDVNNTLLGGLLIAGENGMYASNELYRITHYSLTRDDWYRKALAANGKHVLIPRPIGRNIRSHRDYSADNIVTVARAVYDPESGEPLGVICADMLTDVIEKQIGEIKLGKTGYVFVEDSMGEIVYSPVNDTVYRIDTAGLSETQRALRNIGGQRYQVLCTRSGVTGWSTVGVFQTSETIQAIIYLRRYTLLVAIAAMVLATFTAMSVSNAFARPITRLRLLMAKAEEGDLKVSFDAENYAGEIRQLGQSFNRMMDKIRGLIDMVYFEQQEKREAEIRTLQAQIKPHFLYNTLDTIRWMAEEHHADDIVSIVAALTKLFRISLSRGKEIIPLSEELEHVQSYLYIQKVRYEEKLNYEIDVPESLRGLMVNKLILQPLVENALYHGIKQKRGEGHIRISAVRDGERLVMTVEDDGAGMSEEKCALLNAELRASSTMEHDHGYGIFNVNDRIRLSHGEPYGLSYAVNDRGGISVTLVYPVVRGGER